MTTQFVIDKITYRKDLFYRLPAKADKAYGYGRLYDNMWYPDRNGVQPTSIIIHTTNGARGSSFEGEANFLLTTRDVSAHYLVGKQGQIVRFLPDDCIAWHAGDTIDQFSNWHSIGIERHYTPGEEISQLAIDATTWLVRSLIAQYGIKLSSITTHRYAASLVGRTDKIDPSDQSNVAFALWRDLLFENKHVWGNKVPFHEDMKQYAIYQQWLLYPWLGQSLSLTYADDLSGDCTLYCEKGAIVYFADTGKTFVCGRA